jgi:ubiquinone/menaquinone biosynthesis C-methylase UbiE
VPFDTQAIRRAYQRNVDAYEKTFADNLEVNEFDRTVIDDALAGQDARSTIIDLGCGPGQVAGHAVRTGHRPIGLDLTPSMLAVARRHHPHVPLACGDLLALPIRSSSVDAIVAFFAIHNLPRDVLPTGLTELRRVLRRAGTLVVGTHEGRGQVVLDQPGSESGTVVVTYYQSDELVGLLYDNGFSVRHLRRRRPRDHERHVPKLFITAAAD